MTMSLKYKYLGPTTELTVKDKNLPPDEMLQVDRNQLGAAKKSELCKSIKLRFLEDPVDRTIDELTVLGKAVNIEGMSAQMRIADLRNCIAKQENQSVEDITIFSRTSFIPDNHKIGDLFVDWMGSGMDNWPPQLFVKPRIRGFELLVFIPKMRDTQVWDNHRMSTCVHYELLFDVEPSTTVLELKTMIQKRTKIPTNRHILHADLRDGYKTMGTMVELDNNTKTLQQFGVDTNCLGISFTKSTFDENGRMIFDDAYWDEEGYHAPPESSWIPQDSIACMNRPDFSNVDPNQPLSIITDRRQAEAAAAADDK